MSKDALPKKRTEKLVGENKLQKIFRSSAFSRSMPNPSPPKAESHKFFIFRWEGDSIEGVLSPPITNYRRNTSYILEQQNGSKIEFFGNKYLHDAIRDNELVGFYIRIEYVGNRVMRGYARSQKIYAIYKVEGWDLEVPQQPKQKGD